MVGPAVEREVGNEAAVIEELTEYRLEVVALIVDLVVITARLDTICPVFVANFWFVILQIRHYLFLYLLYKLR